VASLFPRPARPALPADEKQRTALKFIIAAALLIGAVTFGAHACSEHWTNRPEMDRYVRLGPRQGPLELERDLTRAFPPGGDVGPLFARLERLGFDCGPAVDPSRNGACRFRAQREDRKVATILVAVSHDGLRQTGIIARMTVDVARRD
jgi:hypothetical protein